MSGSGDGWDDDDAWGGEDDAWDDDELGEDDGWGDDLGDDGLGDDDDAAWDDEVAARPRPADDGGAGVEPADDPHEEVLPPRRRRLVASPVDADAPGEPTRLDVPVPVVAGPRYLDDVDEEEDRYEEERARASRRWAAIAALLLLIGASAALALVLASDDDGGESASDVDAVESTTTTTLLLNLPGNVGSTTSSSLGGTSTTALGGTDGTDGAGATTSSTRPSTTSSTTSLEDTNDPECAKQGKGDATLDPKPLTVGFCVDDAHPKVGQPVKITGVATDPDSQVEEDCIKVTFDDEPVPPCQPVSDPPSPIANREFAVTHVFTTPGKHTIHVAAASDPPRGSVAATVYTITVHA